MKTILFILLITLSGTVKSQSIEDAMYLIELSDMSFNDAIKDINNKYEAVSYFTEGVNHIFYVQEKSIIISDPGRFDFNMVTLVHKSVSDQNDLLNGLRSMSEFIEDVPIEMTNGAMSYRFETDWCIVALLFDQKDGVYAITAFKK